jgi:hypothetical protein
MPLECANMDWKIHNISAISAAYVGLAILGAITVGGCSNSGPRMRMGAFFGSPGGMSYPDPAHMGKHSYESSAGEKEGLVYTLRGGFIDVGHVREAADRAAYVANLSYENLAAGRPEFTCRVVDPSLYRVSVSYPPGWEKMSQRDQRRLASEASIPLGQYIAHKSLVWHEIITWYGFASTGIFSEKISSFSPEDTYSDATGIMLAGMALRDRRPYDDAMTALFDERLRFLGAEPPDVARKAVSLVDGDWYTGGMYIFVQLKKRNFDVGQDNGYLTPWLVPQISGATKPLACPVPSLEPVTQLGFRVSIVIDPEIWEQNQIYHSIKLDSHITMIRPEEHFPELIDYIQRQAKGTNAPETLYGNAAN